MSDATRLTDDDKLDGHENSEKVEDDLKGGPARRPEETPGAGREDEGVPCCDGEGADEEVLVSTEMGREIERRGKVEGRHGRHKEGPR